MKFFLKSIFWAMAWCYKCHDIYDIKKVPNNENKKMDIISISCFWHQKKWSETCFTPSAVLWNMVKICPLVLKIKHMYFCKNGVSYFTSQCSHISKWWASCWRNLIFNLSIKTWESILVVFLKSLYSSSICILMLKEITFHLWINSLAPGVC